MRLRKEERIQRRSLTLLFAGVVFFILLCVILIVGGSLYVLMKNGVIAEEEGMVNGSLILGQMILISVILGALIVGNHAQMNGPIAGELCVPGTHYTWCASQMMELREVPAYAYRDFWSGKPGYIRWFYKLLSYLIPPLSVCVFNNANTIPVYRDGRVVTTFRETAEKLTDGAFVTVFPEHAAPHNHIVRPSERTAAAGVIIG